MRTAKCQFCNGTGANQIAGNPDAFEDPHEESYNPKAQPFLNCEECGGSGKDLTVMEHKPVRYSKYSGD